MLNSRLFPIKTSNFPIQNLTLSDSARKELIIADGVAADIRELLHGSSLPTLLLDGVSEPLLAISNALQDRPIDTLHLVAHGHAGGFMLGGHWVDAKRLRESASLLAQWKLARIALWICEAGANTELVDEFARLTGAEIHATPDFLGWVNDAASWQLSRVHTGATSVARLQAAKPLDFPFQYEQAQSWRSQLSAMKFVNAYAVNTATTPASREQNSIDFNTSSLGSATVTDGSNGVKFSGIDVVVKLTINGTDHYGWISRPIKSQGKVKGFYFWKDANFTDLSTATADGNKDGDGNAADNSGFVLVVDQTYFDGLAATGSLKTVGSSSDRIDTTLNAVKPVNNAPLAVNDSATFLEDSSNQTGNVLSNDTDANGDTLSVSSFKVDGSAGTLGSAYTITGVGSFTLNADGSYSFTPVANYAGPVPGITYVVSDGSLTSNGNLSISLTAVNDAPAGADKTITSAENQAYTFSAADFGMTDSNDSPANALDAVIIKTLPGAGTLKLNGANVSVDQVITAADISKLTFTPVTDASGASYANFTFQVRDNGGTTNSGVNLDASANTITLNVSSVNSAPTAVVDTVNATEAGGAANATAGTNPTGNVLSNDTDPDSSDGKTVLSAKSAAASDTTVATNTSITGVYGTLVISTDGSYTYTVNNANTAVEALRTSANTLTDTFNYTMKDTAGLKSSSTLTVTVQGANDTPDAINDSNVAKESIVATTADQYLSTDITGYKATGNVLSNDTDADSTANSETKTVAGLSGSASANVVASANVSSKLVFSAASTLSPVGTGDYLYVDVGTNDFRALLNTAGAHITVVTKTDLGSGSYEFVLSDTQAKYYDANGNISISTLNARIIGFNSSTANTNGGGGNTKTATVSSSSATGNSTSTLTSISGTVAAGMSVTGTGIPSGTTIESIAYDGSGNPTLTLSAVVTATNGAALTFTATVGTTLTGRYGSLVLAADGAYTYTPKANNVDLSEGGSGTDSFTYRLTDASSAEDTAVLAINVQGSGTNDPDANADVATAVEAGGISNATAGTDPTGNVLTTSPGADTTPSGTGTLTVTKAALSGGSEATVSTNTEIIGNYGTLTISSDGSYSYAVTNGNTTVNALRTSSDTLTETFTYRIINSTSAKEAVTTLTITIQGGNDTPIAVADTASAYEAGGIANAALGSNPSGNLLSNDTDVDTGDGKSVSAFSTSGGSTGSVDGSTALSGTYGTLTVGTNGSYTYTVDNSNTTVQALALGGSVSESFNYTVKDTAAATASSTLTVTVNGANDAPVNTVPGTQTVAEAGTVSISGVSVADVDSTSLTVTLTVLNGTMVVTQNGGAAGISNSGTATVTITGSPAAITTALGTLSYTGATDFNGTDTLKIVSTDGSLTDTDTFDITVTADNRSLSVTGTTVNEASPYALFQVTGVASQKVSLSLGSTASTGDTDASSGTDFLPNMQYYNGSAWTTYSGGLVSIPSGGTTMLVRVPVLNDNADEPDETFTLTATNKAGTGSTPAVSTIVDTGDGVVFLAANTTFTASGSGDTGYPTTLDDDRALTINNISVNENSSHAVFKVQGVAGQVVTLAQVAGSATATTDYGTSLEVWGGSSWGAYSTSTTLPTGGALLVRSTVADDATYEGPETFGLKATNGGGVSYTGTATIFDDGTGLVYNGSVSGSDAVTSSSGLDNDLSIAITASTPVNEASLYSMFAVTATSGSALTLGLAGSGSPQATTSGFTYAFTVDGGTNWTTYSANDTPVAPGTLGSGTSVVHVRVAISSEADTTYEGAETFTNTATLSAGGTSPLSAAAQATIIDDGTGSRYDSTITSGTANATTSSLDNDKPTVSVSSVTVSESSAYAVFTASLSNASTAAISFTPSLANGTATVGTDTGNTPSTAVIEYYNGSAWVSAASGVSIAAASTSVLLRTAITNDTTLETSETFTLSTGTITGTVTNTGAATGTGTIKDDGSSTNVFLVGNTTATPTAATADNDKPTLSINNITVSEASPYAVFKLSLSNASTAAISFTPSLANGTATVGTDTGNTPSGAAIEYYNGSNWVSAASGVSIAAASTSVLLRTAITNDTTLETSETFTLSTGTITGSVTNTGTATGTATIKDDGSSSNVFLVGNTTETPSTGTADNDNASHGLTLTGTTLTTSETATQASFTVKLNSQPSADVTVTMTGLDATEGSLDKTTLTFTNANWNSAQTVTVTGVNDTLDDGDIAYTLTATSSSTDSNYGTTPRTGTVAVTNTDDDAAPTLAISDVSASEGAGDFTFTVTRSGATGGTTTVNYATANGTALSGSDYTAKSGSLSFAPGETSKTIAVSVTDDTAVESSEAFTVGLSNIADASSSAESITDNSGAGTISDNDSAGLTLTGTTLTTSETGTNASFTVKLNSQPSGDVTVTVTGLDATEGSLDKTTLTFTNANWNSAQTVTVTGANDTLDDGDIAYTLTATSSSTDGNYNGGNARTGTVAVTNSDDDAAPTLAISDVSGGEGAGTFTFTVTRSGATGGTTTVDYATANGTALAGSDYTAKSGSLSFAPGETSKTIAVSITDDTAVESSEAFTVGLSNIADASSSAESISDNSGTATISDNDIVNGGLTITGTTLSTSETGTDTSFSVELNSKPSADVTVTVAGLDSTEGSLSTSTLTFTSSNWNTAQSITITGADDTLDDGDIAYTLTATSSSTDANYGGANARTGTIDVTNTDNEAAPTLSISDASGAEGSGTLTFTVTRSGSTGGTTTVDYATANGTALAGSDYTAKSGSLTFAPGETSKTISVSITADTVSEDSEAFTVGLSNIADASSSSESITDNSGTGTISADKNLAPVLSVSDITVGEDAGNAVLTVTRSGGTAGITAVQYATQDGSAKAGSDYTAVSGTLTFAAGETSKTISVPITDDKLAEDTENFKVVLSDASDSKSATVKLNQTSAQVSITDNEQAIKLSISDVSVSEADGTALLIVTREGASGGTTTLNYSTADSTAVAGKDYSALSGALTFLPGETSKSIRIKITDDKLIEATETINVALSNVTDSSGKAVTVSKASGTVSITDNDSGGLLVSAVAVQTSELGATGSFTVSLLSEPTSDVTVSFSGVDATEGSLSTTALQFTASDWQQPKTVTVTGLDDDLADGDIQYSINVASSSNDSSYSGAGIPLQTVTVTNKDNEALSVKSVSTGRTEEGGTLSYQVVLNAASALVQNYSLSFGGDASAEDFNTPQFTNGVSYDSALGILTVPAGVTEFSVNIPTIDDLLVEKAEETLLLTIGGVEAAGIIEDNDLRPNPLLITDVTETPTDPTPFDLLTGDTTQVIIVTGAPNHQIRLYTAGGELIPVSGYTVTEAADGQYQIDARGIRLEVGDYVVRQVDEAGNESFDSNALTVDSTPEIQDNVSARALLPDGGMTGRLAVIDQNRVDLTSLQFTQPPQNWYDSDGEPAVFGIAGGTVVNNIIVFTAASGSTLTLNIIDGAYTYIPSEIAVLDVFPTTVRDPGGKGGNLNLTFEVRDLLDRDGVPSATEDELAQKLTGGNKDLNNDGVDDSAQNSVSTLAWNKQQNFTAAISGQFDQVSKDSVISIIVHEDSASEVPSPIAQLIGIDVLSFAGEGSGSLGKAGLEEFVLPWDPLAFSIEPLQSLGLIDIDTERAGLQTRVTIDISAAGLRDGKFDSYMKYISAETIQSAVDAGIELTTFDGVILLSSEQAGWYDFMSREPGADGARFIVKNGIITQIEIILTDNVFGDVDFTVGRITDPGLPVALPDFAPPEITVEQQKVESLDKAVVENTSLVTQFASDEPTLWQIVDGDDADLFTLSADGLLSFAVSPDFEKPGDKDKDNQYHLVVSALDAAGNEAQVITTVNVTDVPEAKPVFAALLEQDDHWLTGLLDNANDKSINDDARIEFYSFEAQKPGSLPLKAWVNTITGDYFYAPEGTEPPYACYIPSEEIELGYVPQAGQGAFDVHLFMNSEGITQIMGVETAGNLGLVAAGYVDIGVLFASPEALGTAIELTGVSDQASAGLLF
ncbi:MAG: DUF4347 domain-containing protein [Pseudohongiella sp.]|nr:DUF4347 domain-containing protein [Pseudohongiella sp.]